MTPTDESGAPPVTDALARTRDRPANVRATLAVLADELDPARLRTWLDEALNAEKDAWTTCPDCHHRVPIKVADWANRAKVLEMFMNQGKGAPTKAAEPPKAGGKLGDMSDADLEALLEVSQSG